MRNIKIKRVFVQSPVVREAHLVFNTAEKEMVHTAAMLGQRWRETQDPAVLQKMKDVHACRLQIQKQLFNEKVEEAFRRIAPGDVVKFDVEVAHWYLSDESPSDKATVDALQSLIDDCYTNDDNTYLSATVVSNDDVAYVVDARGKKVVLPERLLDIEL